MKLEKKMDPKYAVVVLAVGIALVKVEWWSLIMKTHWLSFRVFWNIPRLSIATYSSWPVAGNSCKYCICVEKSRYATEWQSSLAVAYVKFATWGGVGKISVKWYGAIGLGLHVQWVLDHAEIHRFQLLCRGYERIEGSISGGSTFKVLIMWSVENEVQRNATEVETYQKYVLRLFAEELGLCVTIWFTRYDIITQKTRFTCFLWFRKAVFFGI